MATWIVHLRIADAVINRDIVPCEYKREFIYGSLAPDCGYGTKDSYGEFTPPPKVTHRCPDGCKIFCEYADFYNEYLKDKEKNSDYYFYLGYYVHLITDVLWSASIYFPTRFKYADKYRANPEFLKTIKNDWYGLDFDFIKKNPDFEPYALLQSIDTVKDYLPYYEKGQLTTQIKYIANYYSKENISTATYTYLTEAEMNEFINLTVELITNKIT